MNEVIKILFEAPESQICPTIVERLKNINFDDNENAITEMKSILDDSARYSLASDFAMYTMDIIYKTLLGEEE